MRSGAANAWSTCGGRGAQPASSSTSRTERARSGSPPNASRSRIRSTSALAPRSRSASSRTRSPSASASRARSGSTPASPTDNRAAASTCAARRSSSASRRRSRSRTVSTGRSRGACAGSPAERDMLEIVRKSIAMLPADRRWQWVALPIMAALMGAAEAGAAAAVFGLIKIIADPTAVASVPVAGPIARMLPWQDRRSLVLTFTLLVAVYHVSKNALGLAAQYARHKIIGESNAALACTMLRGYLLAPYPFHFRRHSSELLVGAGIAAVLLAASPEATLAAGVVLGVLIVVLLRGTRRLARRTGRGGHELQRELLQTLQNAL